MATAIIPGLSFSTGPTAGIAVTRRLHRDPGGRWGERLRFANLPVGGTIAIALSMVLPSRVAVPVRALGVGALVGAVGWGIADPLPPLPVA